MKRILPLLLSVLLLLLMVTGCTNQKADPDATPEPAPSWLVLPDLEQE
ncbi:MAG: hypothetical protein HFF18_13985 [Oscillospiraceae bacterium]|nr:hypothetical protein [Oscillospiraceae bacterium]